jgi:hypothetical protein
MVPKENSRLVVAALNSCTNARFEKWKVQNGLFCQLTIRKLFIAFYWPF